MNQQSSVSFGTSGLRGLVSDLSNEVCYAFVSAFLHVMPKQNCKKVSLAIDLRPSSPRIAEACACAIQQAGLEVDYCGIIPTPALAFYSQLNNQLAIMVTGSHIPFERNGIKFYGLQGEISKADENAILANVEQFLDRQLTLTPLRKINTVASATYVARYQDFFPPLVLQGLKLGVFEHTSASRDLLQKLLTNLGAEVISLGRSESFVPIDTEALSVEDELRAQSWIKQYHLDAILSTDGDGDRPLMALDNGVWLRGDLIGLLSAYYLQADAIATPITSTSILESCQLFSEILRTKVGSPYVIEATARLLEKPYRCVVGFEPNGGFLLATDVIMEGRTISKLNTRDAILPMLAILALASRPSLERPIAKLLDGFPTIYAKSSRIPNVSNQVYRHLMTQLMQTESEISHQLVEALGDIVKLEDLDGLRLYFSNGTIVHFRASGNAPELRCYIEANSKLALDKINQICLDLLSQQIARLHHLN